jgi:hypothetical protein
MAVSEASATARRTAIASPGLSSTKRISIGGLILQ